MVIHYIPRRSGQAKSGMDAKLFEEAVLLDLGEHENDNVGNAENITLEGIVVSTWAKRNGLWLVREEHRLEVLRLDHDSPVAGPCGRH